MKQETRRKSGKQPILWWVLWITATIVSFFIAVWFWTPVIASRFGSIHQSRTAVIWVAAVFGTWLLFLVPLIIMMYAKVDKVYEDARIAREKREQQFRSLAVERARRALPASVAEKIRRWPETIDGGHLVNLQLKQNRTIANAFVSNGEILGLYDVPEMTFDAADVCDAEEVDWKSVPKFTPRAWLRLDGASAPH